jgi:hypothetical protein
MRCRIAEDKMQMASSSIRRSPKTLALQASVLLALSTFGVASAGDIQFGDVPMGSSKIMRLNGGLGLASNSGGGGACAQGIQTSKLISSGPNQGEFTDLGGTYVGLHLPGSRYYEDIRFTPQAAGEKFAQVTPLITPVSPLCGLQTRPSLLTAKALPAPSTASHSRHARHAQSEQAQSTPPAQVAAAPIIQAAAPQILQAPPPQPIAAPQPQVVQAPQPQSTPVPPIQVAAPQNIQAAPSAPMMAASEARATFPPVVRVTPPPAPAIQAAPAPSVEARPTPVPPPPPTPMQTVQAAAMPVSVVQTAVATPQPLPAATPEIRHAHASKHSANTATRSEAKASIEDAPSILTLAGLTKANYADKAQTVGAYHRLSDSCGMHQHCDANGITARAYANADTSQIVIVLRGSAEQHSLRDGLYGGPSAASIAQKSLVTDIQSAAAFLTATAMHYPNAVVTLTGHSFGGSIAQLLSAVSGDSAYTFGAPGAKRLFVQSAIPFSGFPSAHTKRYQNINIRVAGDQVSRTGMQLGQTVTLEAPADGHYGDNPPDIIANACTKMLGLLQHLHGMDTIYSQIKSGAPTVDATKELDLIPVLDLDLWCESPTSLF